MKSNQSVQRAVAILRAVAAAQPDGETAAGLARAAELPHPTALRLIRTLEAEGFVMQVDARGRYVLGVELLSLAGGDATRVLAAAARPVLEELAGSASETATLSIPHRDSVEVVLQVDGPRLVGVVNWVGERFPLHATASGKVVLAAWGEDRLERYLSQPLERLAARTITDPGALRAEVARVREQGYAVIEDELEDGLFGVSAPVHDRSADAPERRRLVCAVTLSGPCFRYGREARSAAVPLLRVAARTIEERLYPRVDEPA